MSNEEKKNRLGARLRMLRTEKGLTLEELATKLGKTRAAVGHWEQSNRQPNLDELLWLSEFFECTVDYLLGNSDERKCSVYKTAINGHDVSITYRPGEMDHEFSYEDALRALKKLESIGIKVDELLK